MSTVKCSFKGAKVIRYFSLGLLTAVLLFQVSWAIEIGDGVDVNGSVRWRTELDDRDFCSETPLLEKPYLRSRFGLTITKIEDAVIFFQIQDSRNLGVNSSGLNNDTNLGVHQAYVKWMNLLKEERSIQVGRFEVVYGRQRIMGSVGWHNVGRSFDGVRLSCDTDKFKFDIFSLKVNERSFGTPGTPAIPPDTIGTPPVPASHNDQVLYGLYATCKKRHVDAFFLFDWDQQKTNGKANLKRFTGGFYFYHNFENGLRIDLDGAYQFGKAVNTDIAAFMVAGDVSYELDSFVKKVGFGFDNTSGDDDPNKINSFDNLYYTGHKFRGFMDYFLGTTHLGLNDIVLRGVFNPTGSLDIYVDAHHFIFMKDYTNASGNKTKAIGTEIDITGKLPVQKGLALQGGASAFLPSDDYIQDGDTAFWFYAMLTAYFK
ncbi:MAG: alginate export family protein [candidate division Zixibacteria bacterium]|nr:alginate export family protein [candidate division Zixibacteria bacterium]